jgi:AP-3 complex subunit beta
MSGKKIAKAFSSAISSIGKGDAKFFDEEANPTKIRKLLDNSSINKQAGINERLRALKWLLAQTASGKDVSEFFPDVVKNVIVTDVQVKKFVYMYLTYYADATAETRELALLSINTFQRDMSSPNQLLRSLALRVMCSIRIRDIVQLQMLAVNTCARDSSPYVRKTAAYALPKLYRLDPDQKPQLVEILDKLIGDNSTLVFGSAIAAFNEICPEQLEVIHPHFRKLCKRLNDLDEWGQMMVMHVLLRYSRTQFMDPRTDPNTGLIVEKINSTPDKKASSFSIGVDPNSKRAKQDRATSVEALDGFYSDDEDEKKKKEASPKIASSDNNDDNNETKDASGLLSPDPVVAPISSAKPKARGVNDADHQLILATSLNLLHSQSSGVIMAVASLHWYLGSRKDITTAKIVKALCRIFRTSRPEIQHVILENILKFAALKPKLFQPYISDFYIRLSIDRAGVRMKKLDMLTLLVSENNVQKLLKEFADYVRHPDKLFVSSCVSTYLIVVKF